VSTDYYTAPRDCPVCSEQLHVTRLGCPQCGTALSGQFHACEFCGMSDADRDLLWVFLTSRGNMREVERHLAVSYPTARARFDDLLRRLGHQPAAEPSTAAGSPAGGAGSPDSSTGSAMDPRLATLHALAAGQVDVDDARRLLGGG